MRALVTFIFAAITACTAETATTNTPVSDCYGNCCPSTASADVAACNTQGSKIGYAQTVTYRCVGVAEPGPDGKVIADWLEDPSVCGVANEAYSGPVPAGDGKLVCCSRKL